MSSTIVTVIIIITIIVISDYTLCSKKHVTTFLMIS